MSTECISNESLTVVCVFSIITRRKSWFNGKNLVKLKKISWFHNITLNVNKEFLRVPSRADFFVYEIRRHTLSNVFLLHVTVVKKYIAVLQPTYTDMLLGYMNLNNTYWLCIIGMLLLLWGCRALIQFLLFLLYLIE